MSLFYTKNGVYLGKQMIQYRHTTRGEEGGAFDDYFMTDSFSFTRHCVPRS